MAGLNSIKTNKSEYAHKIHAFNTLILVLNYILYSGDIYMSRSKLGYGYSDQVVKLSRY